MASLDEKDRYGDKLIKAEHARENQWAAERDRELITRLRHQADERAATAEQRGTVLKVFKRILCPISFDKGSLAALDLAKHLAAQNDAELDVLHVRTMFGIPARRGVATEVESEQSARLQLEEIARKHLANCRYNLSTFAGEAAQKVIDLQLTTGADLIVMGTHGRRGAPRFFLGSVADRVVREAGCPVLTTKVARTASLATTRYATRRILCPLDFEESSLKALDLASRMAGQNGAEMYLVHVCPSILVPLGGLVTDRVMAEEDAKQRMEEIARTRLRDIRYELLITTGNAPERVRTMRSGLGADLIVMGTHGRRPASRFFLGSVADRVIRESACPVITVRQE